MPAPFISVDEAARLLHAGKLVAFPTDTVYGVAGAADGGLGADPDSAALRAFKGGRPEPFSLHVSDVESALHAVGLRTFEEQAALERLCPRGTTVVIRWHQRGLGVRVVAHDIGSKFLQAGGGVPVLASSANLHGKPTPRDPREIATLPGIAGVIDGGVLPPRPASTVVRLLPTGLQMLREGALTRAELDRVFTRPLHFVCLGNLNRSAFAHHFVAAMQAWMTSNVDGFVPAWRPRSSGVIASPSMTVPEPMRQAATAFGVDLSAHQPTRFAPGNDVMVCMGDEVAEIVGPTTRAEFINLRVPDPMGGAAQAYADTTRAIVNGLRHALLAGWAPAGDAQLESQLGKLFWGA